MRRHTSLERRFARMGIGYQFTCLMPLYIWGYFTLRGIVAHPDPLPPIGQDARNADSSGPPPVSCYSYSRSIGGIETAASQQQRARAMLACVGRDFGGVPRWRPPNDPGWDERNH